MKALISGTTAYSVFSRDVASGAISHAYMLYFQDADNARRALKIFAMKFFGVTEDDADGKRILNETFPDVRIFPEEGKKFNAECASALLADCALKPVERDKKLFIITGFNDTAPIIQNKLLKTLEEPCEGVYFLLGATSLAPVLDTVKSRVKMLTVAPFSESEIFSALERQGSNPLNKSASENCGGVLGVAESMVNGGWFASVSSAADEICTADKISKAGAAAVKYGDIKYKSELLSAVATRYHNAVEERVKGKALSKCAQLFETPALIFAGECADRACRDLKFNAYFQGLLYDMMLRIIEENEKWLKLRR